MLFQENLLGSLWTLSTLLCSKPLAHLKVGLAPCLQRFWLYSQMSTEVLIHRTCSLYMLQDIIRTKAAEKWNWSGEPSWSHGARWWSSCVPRIGAWKWWKAAASVQSVEVHSGCSQNQQWSSSASRAASPVGYRERWSPSAPVTASGCGRCRWTGAQTCCWRESKW